MDNTCDLIRLKLNWDEECEVKKSPQTMSKHLNLFFCAIVLGKNGR